MEYLLRDVHHYFFNSEISPRPGESYRVRDELQRRFLEHVVAHADDRRMSSSTTAWDDPHLRLRAQSRRVPADRRPHHARQPARARRSPGRGRAERRSGRLSCGETQGAWLNIYDPLDPVVGFDPRFANDYMRDGAEVVVDIRESNWGEWRHDIVKYLGGPRLRAELKRLLTGAALESLAKARAPSVGVTSRAASDRESVGPASSRTPSRAPSPAPRRPPVVAPRLDPSTLRKLPREELARLGDEVRERQSVNELQDECADAVGVLEIIDLRDVGVIECRKHLCFTFETRQVVNIACDRLRQNSYCDITIQFRITCAVDLTHAAAANERQDFVSAEASAGRNRHFG
jgi:hypothetical protein